MNALAQVSENAEGAASHMHFLGVSLLKLDAQMERVSELLAALKPYTPLAMRDELYYASLGLFNACEQTADASEAVVGDYVGALLLAQACTSHLSVERD